MQVKCKYKMLKVNSIAIYDCMEYSRAVVVADIDAGTAEKEGKTEDKSIEIYTDDGEKLFEGMIENEMAAKTECQSSLIINASTSFDLGVKKKSAAGRGIKSESDLSGCRIVPDENDSSSGRYSLADTAVVKAGDAVVFKGRRFCVTRSVMRYEAADARLSCDCQIEPI